MTTLAINQVDKARFDQFKREYEFNNQGTFSDAQFIALVLNVYAKHKEMVE